MEVQLIRKKIKNLYLQIKDGKVIVKAPYRVKEQEIQKLLQEKEKWIKKQLQKQANNENPNQFLLKGKTYPIQINLSPEEEKIEFNGERVNIYLRKEDEERKQQLLQQLYQEQARKQYIQTTQKIMAKTGLQPELWKIRNIQSAWGTCSSKKVITLSLNLIKKREEVIEYVVLHELCHLKYMNHSKEFWNLVGTYMPEYAIYRRELRG